MATTIKYNLLIQDSEKRFENYISTCAVILSLYISYLLVLQCNFLINFLLLKTEQNVLIIEPLNVENIHSSQHYGVCPSVISIASVIINKETEKQ